MAGGLAVLEETSRRDGHTLTLQENRALDIIEGRRPAKKARFVKTSGQKTTLDTASLERARALVGLKGYVTNITADVHAPGRGLVCRECFRTVPSLNAMTFMLPT
ncbi:hypothetical protein GCM10023068_44330 [Leifsonia shinshuensis]